MAKSSQMKINLNNYQQKLRKQFKARINSNMIESKNKLNLLLETYKMENKKFVKQLFEKINKIPCLYSTKEKQKLSQNCKRIFCQVWQSIKFKFELGFLNRIVFDHLPTEAFRRYYQQFINSPNQIQPQNEKFIPNQLYHKPKVEESKSHNNEDNQN